MQSSIQRANIVTIANTEDLIVPSSSASILGACPKRVAAVAPSSDPCVLTLTGPDIARHGLILDSNKTQLMLDQVLVGTTVNGQVVDSVTNQAIASAQVSVDSVAISTTTGPDGRFSLMSVPLGAQKLTVTASGYTQGHQTMSDPDSVVITPTVRLAALTGMLTGVVTDGTSGAVINGASVSIQGTSIQTTTVNGGHFALPDVPNGIRTLTTIAPGFRTGSLSVNVAVGTNPAVSIVLIPSSAIRIQRVSVAADGSEGDNHPGFPGVNGPGSVSLTDNGRFVAFTSSSSNLVPGDTNGSSDVFVKDRMTGAIERVSVASDGTQADFPSQHAHISSDGRYVLFYSYATNLHPNSGAAGYSAYIKDRQSGGIRLVTLVPAGVNFVQPVISADRPSSNGRYVAFSTLGAQLIPDDTNGVNDVFIRDFQTDSVERVSLAAGGLQGNKNSDNPAMSPDLRYIVFDAAASNLVPNDTNGYGDVFFKDRQTGALELISMTTNGAQGDSVSGSPRLSSDGRFVAFNSRASNLVQNAVSGNGEVFVKDRQTGAIELISVGVNGAQANGPSGLWDISADGRYVAFMSYASNIVSDDSNGLADVFVKDRLTGAVERVNVASNGTEANIAPVSVSLSADGRYVAFSSEANNLVSGDTNGVMDSFVVDRLVPIQP